MQKLTPALKKEVQYLYKIGLEEYEVEYLLHEKLKQKAKNKWN